MNTHLFGESPLKAREIKTEKTIGDMHTIRTKMDKTATAGHSIINFVEGTRFHILKSEKQKSRFKYLLNPHTGGLFYILKNYGEKLDAILDFTIVYGCKSPVFWKFLSGALPSYYRRPAKNSDQRPVHFFRFRYRWHSF